MDNKEIKRLSRADLLEMLIDQSEELEKVKTELQQARADLQKRELAINNAGSIAEASLQLNGIFEAAQASCEQYIENIRKMSEKSEEENRIREEEVQKNIDKMLNDTRIKCDEMEKEAQEKCDKMVEKARTESKEYWDEVSTKIESLYNEYSGLRRLLAVDITKKVREDEAEN